MKRARIIRKKGTQPHPFRIAALCLIVLVLFMGTRISSLADKAERVKEDVFKESEAYFNAQSRYNRLKSEVNEINTDDFVERTARRDYGYCWYGETIYTVVNLDELEKSVADEKRPDDEEDSEAKETGEMTETPEAADAAPEAGN